MDIQGANLIGYQTSQLGEVTFCAINPVLNTELPTRFHQATLAELGIALQLADSAFRFFSTTSPGFRADFLSAIAERLEANQSELCHWFCLETGLPQERAISELTRSCFQLRAYGEAVRSGKVLNATIETGDPNRQPTPKPDLRKINISLGPVAVFGASNFPFAYSVIGGDVASALAAGCPVIVKGHAMHPHTGELPARLILETAKAFGLPEGVFSFLHAKDFTIGEQLVLDHRIKAVGFTGSVAGGTALQQLAMTRPDPIPVFAEMGSLNPVILLPGSLAESGESITDKLKNSISVNAGQFCTKPGLIFLLQSETSTRWLQSFAQSLKDVGPVAMLHPELYKRFLVGRDEQLNGAEVLVASEETQPNFICPTLLQISGRAFIQEAQRQSEVFGPFSIAVVFDSLEEMELGIELMGGHLTGSIFATLNEEKTVNRLLPLLSDKVGRIILNGVPTGVEVSVAMQHGGPFPSSTDVRSTSVGADAILRFMRPLTYQNCPQEWLPEGLRDENPLGILRFINGSVEF